MGKGPAVLFYTADFLVGCTGLTMTERGQYITLLCLQHQKGRLSKKEILEAVPGGVSSDVMIKFKKDNRGRYYNERMEKEALKRQRYSESRSKNVSTRYKNKESTYEGTYVLHMENENENINNTLVLSNTTDMSVAEDIDNTNSFSFSTTTTTNNPTYNGARTREEASVLIEREDGTVEPLTDELLADIEAQAAFEQEVKEYFAEEGYISSVELFISYNSGRRWKGHNGVDIRKYGRWVEYAKEWERKERRKRGVPIDF